MRLQKIAMFLILAGFLLIVAKFARHNSDSYSDQQGISDNHSASKGDDTYLDTNPSQICKTCGVNHNLDQKNSHKQMPTIPKKLEKFMSRDVKNLTFETKADGASVVHLNGTFGHMSSAQTNADGSITVHCASAHEELINTKKENTSVK